MAGCLGGRPGGKGGSTSAKIPSPSNKGRTDPKGFRNSVALAALDDTAPISLRFALAAELGGALVSGNVERGGAMARSQGFGELGAVVAAGKFGVELEDTNRGWACARASGTMIGSPGHGSGISGRLDPCAASTDGKGDTDVGDMEPPPMLFSGSCAAAVSARVEALD